MEGSMIDLSKYRFESAKDDLEIFMDFVPSQLWQNLIPVNILA